MKGVFLEFIRIVVYRDKYRPGISGYHLTRHEHGKSVPKTE